MTPNCPQLDWHEMYRKPERRGYVELCVCYKIRPSMTKLNEDILILPTLKIYHRQRVHSILGSEAS